MTHTHAFRWQEHLRISEGTSQEDAKHISDALDTLASIPEGQTLITRAQKLHNICCGDPKDARMPIRSGIFEDPAERTFSHANHHGVSLDRRDTHYLMYKAPDGSNVQMGLMHVLVHELYHKGDIQAAHDEGAIVYAMINESPPSEKYATAYTDHFMAKHFNMPPRGDYTNAFYTDYDQNKPPSVHPRPVAIDCGWQGALPEYQALDIPWGASSWRQPETDSDAMCPVPTPSSAVSSSAKAR